jgi:hypothetical protein
MYPSPYVVGVSKSTRMGLATHMGETRNAYKILVRKS